MWRVAEEEARLKLLEEAQRQAELEAQLELRSAAIEKAEQESKFKSELDVRRLEEEEDRLNAVSKRMEETDVQGE